MGNQDLESGEERIYSSTIKHQPHRLSGEAQAYKKLHLTWATGLALLFIDDVAQM